MRGLAPNNLSPVLLPFFSTLFLFSPMPSRHSLRFLFFLVFSSFSAYYFGDFLNDFDAQMKLA